MPRLISMPSLATLIVSTTVSVPSCAICTSLLKSRMRSSAFAATGTSASRSAANQRIALGPERHLGRRLDRRVGIGVPFPPLETERAREQHVREALPPRVQVADGGVIVPPRTGEFAFDARQFFLQFAEVR